MADELDADPAARIAELEARLDEADRAQTASARLLRAVSHDLRTPLNNVVGALELIELRAHMPAEVAKWAGVARDASDRLRQMLDDLIAQARGEQA